MVCAVLLTGQHVFAMYAMSEATSCHFEAPLCAAQHERDVVLALKVVSLRPM